MKDKTIATARYGGMSTACCAWSLLLSLSLLSCEKEIDMDYRTAEPLYVVEGLVTQDGTKVRVSTTRAVKSAADKEDRVGDAVIVVSTDWGDEDTLKYRSAGNYVSDIIGIPGVSYFLDVEVGGQHFRASSVMQQLPEQSDFRFVWRKVLTEDMLFAKLSLQDHPDENNFYFMHLYRNNTGYRWAVMRDRKDPGGELQQLFRCSTRKAMDDGSDDDALNEGDRIRVEIRSIDRQTYDYFYSMQQMGSTGTNPTEVFTGGCLGYFSACGMVSSQYIFHRDEVERDEED